MGFGDKLKNLKSQAQDAVAENKDKIQGAVGAVSTAADQRTKGKYTDKIAKFGEKTQGAVDKFGSSGQTASAEGDGSVAEVHVTDMQTEPAVAPTGAPTDSPEAPSSPPEFGAPPEFS